MKPEEITWKIENLGNLTPPELHGLIKVRVDVFVVEQNCAYHELDGKDPECFHVMGLDKDTVIATARVVPPGVIYEYFSIGRVCVAESYRHLGVGRVLMEKSMQFAIEQQNAKKIKIAAQLYLRKFYESYGFNKTSEVYLWDGIDHIDMVWSA